MTHTMPTPRNMPRAVAPQFSEPTAQTAPVPAPVPATPFRLTWERAICRSSLPVMARHVALTIATYAGYSTGRIPSAGHPSLAALAKATGLPPSLTRQSLHTLAAGGWIHRTPAPRGGLVPDRTELLLPARVSTAGPDSAVH